MVLAFAAAYFALEGEIQRRKLAFTAADRALEAENKRRTLMKLDPYTVVAIVAFAGILGAKIWHIIDTPADRLNADMTALVRIDAYSLFFSGLIIAGAFLVTLLSRDYLKTTGEERAGLLRADRVLGPGDDRGRR